MELGFTSSINYQPVYFIEKIWQGLLKAEKAMLKEYEQYASAYADRFGYRWGLPLGNVAPKLHTVRKDKDDLWRAGMEIDFITEQNDGSFRFAPSMPCTKIELVKITPDKTGTILLEGRQLTAVALENFALNDGFRTSAELFAYFTEPFAGKVIHWL